MERIEIAALVLAGLVKDIKPGGSIKATSSKLGDAAVMALAAADALLAGNAADAALIED